MVAKSGSSTSFLERGACSSKPCRPSLEKTCDKLSSILITTVEVGQCRSRENPMSSLQDGSDLACHAHVSSAVPDSRSKELDGIGVLAQLTHSPSVIVNPWTGQASIFAEVLVKEQL